MATAANIDVASAYFGSFADAVMTMISVALGLTLYFVATAIQQLFLKQAWSRAHYFQLSKIIFTFLLAVGLFHMYHYTTPIIFAPPSYFLGLPVFVISTALAVMAVSLGGANYGDDQHNLFCTALVAFYGFCIVAFVQTYCRSASAPLLPDEIASDAVYNVIAYSALAIASGVYWYFRGRTRVISPRIRDFAFLILNLVALGGAMQLTKVRLLDPLAVAMKDQERCIQPCAPAPSPLPPSGK